MPDPINNSPTPAPQPPPPTFTVTTQPSYARTLFLESDGLRPGWGLTFYFATYYLLKRLLLDLTFSHDFGASGLWNDMAGEFVSFLAALIPAIVLAQVERRPWRVYGLPIRQAFGKLFWIGALWGFAAISLLIFLLYGLHAFRFGHIVLHGPRLLRFAAFWALMFLLVGLYEEFLNRGYSLFTLTRGIGFWPAALVLSVAFAAMHFDNPGETAPGLLAVVCIGLFFCLTLRRTGSLWFAVGFHAAWDWGQTFLYSVPDSGLVEPGHLFSSSLRGAPWLTGGSVGPEGSALCFAVIALTCVAFHRVYAEAKWASPIQP
jgi:membrane protease YdiL (CAAX protease family)